MLVFELPDFAREAWRRGKRAARVLERKTAALFRDASARTLRAGDCIAHDPASDTFIVGLFAPSRGERARSTADCRAVLERIAVTLSLGVDLRIDRGWTALGGVRTRAELEAEIRRALERGARERERYEFFAAVGHELRTPLTSIRGYLETLLDEPLDAATTRRFLDTARRETLRLSRLVEGMFEFSLLDLSGARMRGTTCRLAPQIEAACDVVRPLAAARRVTVEAAPSPDADVEIEADALMQMLVNLLDNAIKYGREGGRVTISAAKAAGCARVRVDDDGPGLAPAECESIFGLRVRGERSDSWPGSGIGLALVKLIAERAGGHVGCGTSAMGGARFEIALPARAESETALS